MRHEPAYHRFDFNVRQIISQCGAFNHADVNATAFNGGFATFNSFRIRGDQGHFRSLYEAQRQRQNAGMYLRENSMLPEAEQQRLLFEGGYPVLAKVAKRKGLPYPHVNQQGEIEADADWWATMQAAG